jgi:hypothetical protein
VRKILYVIEEAGNPEGAKDSVRYRLAESYCDGRSDYSQSVKTMESGGPRVYDAGKRIKGHKRHIVTDTQGNLVGLLVHEA